MGVKSPPGAEIPLLYPFFLGFPCCGEWRTRVFPHRLAPLIRWHQRASGRLIPSPSPASSPCQFWYVKGHWPRIAHSGKHHCGEAHLRACCGIADHAVGGLGLDKVFHNLGQLLRGNLSAVDTPCHMGHRLHVVFRFTR